MNENYSKYHRLIGKLIYLTIPISNIFFPVGIVSQFIQAPRKPHLDAIMRILCYCSKKIFTFESKVT